jgi:membrane peptidoglycan carboxypeptidase
LALTLGGGEVRLLELTSAYGVFATGGDLVAPVAVLKILDGSGQTLYVPPTDRRTQAMDPRVAYLITDILSDEWARLPSFGEESALYLGRPAAAKTGTTTDWRDNWTVGYTPDLVAGVWVGNADNAPMYHVSGITGAGPIWHDFMSWALKDRPPRPFVRPDGLVEMEVCALSGKLPNPYCTHRRQELFVAGTEPMAECAIHQLFRIDVATGLQATEYTPPERVRERVYAVYPAEAQTWAIGQGIPQPPPMAEMRVFQGGTEAADRAAAPLEIVSPFQMDRYRISAALPPEDQRIMIEARPGGGTSFAQVTLYVDDEPLGTFAEPPYRLWWALQPGTHAIYAVGETADGLESASEVITLIVTE